MIRLDFDLGPPLGHRATFGLVVLRTDETIEHEATLALRDEGTAIYVSRIPCETEVTPDALARMEAAMPGSAALLPQSIEYDVIAYGCTSGATFIGPDNVAAAVRKGARAKSVTNPLTATLAALNALGAKRIGFVTPYVADVSDAMRARLEASGIEVVSFGSMNEENDERVARISPESLRAAILQVAAAAPCEAIFLACTNLRALALIESVEEEIGIPVLTSNQTLFWHMLKLAGLPTANKPYGALMRTS